MRIAIFSEVFLPKIDGVVRTLCQLLRHLTRRGHKAILFTAGEGPGRHDSTQVVRLGGFPFPAYPDVRLVPPTVDMHDELESFAPDVVHAINPVSLGLAGIWSGRRLGVPVVASYHTDMAGFAQRWGFPILEEPIWSFFRWVHNQADLNLCPSTATLEELRGRGFERLKIWTRGVDTQQFSPQWRSPEWRLRHFPERADAPLLLFVGRLSPEKRVDWLRPVLDAVPGASLAIVGDGPARPRLEHLFAGTPTVFTGYLQGAELARAFASADIFVFPAANETLGNVVLEAMASGLPVVAARAGGPRDCVSDSRTGILFEPEKLDSLSAAVEFLIKSPRQAASYGAAGRALAQGRTWDAVLDGLVGDYQTLAGGSGRASGQTPWPLSQGRQGLG